MQGFLLGEKSRHGRTSKSGRDLNKQPGRTLFAVLVMLLANLGCVGKARCFVAARQRDATSRRTGLADSFESRLSDKRTARTGLQRGS